MNWLDLGILLFILILLLIGLKKGFMTSVLSNFSFSINAILSFFLCKPIGILLNKFGLGASIASNYAEKFISANTNMGANLMEISSENLSGFVTETINNGGFSGFSKFLLKWFINKPSLYDTLHASNHTVRSLSDIISSAYSSFFVSVISFITSIVLLYIVVWLISLLVKKLREIGFVKFVDNFLGAFYGLFRCLLIFIVLSLIIKLISPLSFMAPIIAYINDSFFGNLIYGQINNFFDNYLNFNDIINYLFK